jgi:LPXTG-motif cell wall-anchored protein
VNCGGNSNTAPNSSSTQEITQGQSKQQLADTGASDTTFLVVGAATMLVGGVAFRLMPRLADRRTAA